MQAEGIRNFMDCLGVVQIWFASNLAVRLIKFMFQLNSLRHACYVVGEPNSALLFMALTWFKFKKKKMFLQHYARICKVKELFS